MSLLEKSKMHQNTTFPKLSYSLIAPKLGGQKNTKVTDVQRPNRVRAGNGKRAITVNSGLEASGNTPAKFESKIFHEIGNELAAVPIAAGSENLVSARATTSRIAEEHRSYSLGIRFNENKTKYAQHAPRLTTGFQPKKYSNKLTDISQPKTGGLKVIPVGASEFPDDSQINLEAMNSTDPAANKGRKRQRSISSVSKKAIRTGNTSPQMPDSDKQDGRNIDPAKFCSESASTESSAVLQKKSMGDAINRAIMAEIHNIDALSDKDYLDKIVMPPLYKCLHRLLAEK